MKKQLVLVALALLLLLPGCAEDTMRTWVWGSNEVVGARVGSLVTENNEAGIMLEKQIEDCELVTGGAYAIHYFPEAEFGNPLSFEFLPRIIRGRPFMGGELSIDPDANTSVVSPLVGIIFEESFFLDYQPQAYEAGTRTTGDRVRFGFWFKF